VKFESKEFEFENSLIAENRKVPCEYVPPTSVPSYINKTVENMQKDSYIVRDILAKGCKCYLKSFYISNYVKKSQESFKNM